LVELEKVFQDAGPIRTFSGRKKLRQQVDPPGFGPTGRAGAIDYPSLFFQGGELLGQGLPVFAEFGFPKVSAN